MKPSLLLLSLLAALAVRSSAETFSGPYASVLGGYNRMHVQEGDGSAFYDGGTPGNTYSGHRGNNSTGKGLGGGFGFGWDHRVGNQVVGVEATISYQNTRSDGAAFTGYIGNPGDDHVNTNTRLTESAALKAKYGFVFGKDLNRMAYVTAGLAHAHFQRTLTQEFDNFNNRWLDYGQSVSKAKSALGYTLGLGAESYVGERLSVKGSVDYTNFGGTSFDYVAFVPGFSQSVRISENVHLSNLGFNVAAAYHF
jgi:opacity protein-like surface antigen